MTVVLGRRSLPDEEVPPVSNPSGIRHDYTWEMRRKQYRLAHIPATYPTWQPAPDTKRVEDPAVVQEPEPDPVRPGLMLLYAARMAHARVTCSPMRQTGPGERILVGETEQDETLVRSLAVVGATTRIGRGEDAHYLRLHPSLQMQYGRLRCGGEIMGSRSSVSRSGAATPINRIAAAPAGFFAGVQHLLDRNHRNQLYPRISASKRMMFGTIAAILVLLSAASTSLASQGRYEVQDGDTLQSVAETFGVDADAIRASSYMPNGDSLDSGQVIIIPEEGQSPTDAAQMAAANEGTSPWVATAYWVEWGDSPASIASDFGVSTQDLMDINGISDPLEMVVGTRILIPANATSTDTNSSPSADSDAVTVWVPDYKQQRNLSCEFAAVHSAAMSFGWGPDEQYFIDTVPLAKNPHNGYRGNIDGWWGNTADYGIYAEALVPGLNDWGFEGEVMYTFGDVQPLIEHIDAGHPVVTWLGFWGDTRERLSDDGNYSVFAGMHVVVVYGYDDEGVWVMDPAKGEKTHYSWDFFVGLWSVVDGMSLAVYPA